ncbi:hypothetical protein ABTW72_01510 [Micromonospora sp. NPDC127501]|uniref:hypothetical protein n=1 Tax=Micromonospora sp. NPDC127501 TaxID=3154872 RepID=UPI00332B043E
MGRPRRTAATVSSEIDSIQLPGNRVLSASVNNMVGVDEQAVAAQPGPPLSAEQLRAIAVRVAERVRA